MTPDEKQKEIDEWLSNLPTEIDQSYSFLLENVKKFQTFDLLSYFSFYNHLHNGERYSDFRGDKNFFVSEVIALLCLKSDFINQSSISKDDYMTLIMEMQQTVLNYCGRIDAMQMQREYKPIGENVISDIANILSREAMHIRNPGLPQHHLIFTEKLFEPIKNEVKSIFGFSISDSIIIRNKLSRMINLKCRTVIDETLDNAKKHAKEIIQYRKRKTVEHNSVFTKEQLEKFSKDSDKKIKQWLQVHFLNELYYTFGNIYTFTAEELSEFTKVELDAVKAFLKTFSCKFPSLKAEDKIYEPVTILKTKPIIEHEGRFLIPSFPLMIWAVEDVVEMAIKQKSKLNNKYHDIRHEFVLNQGLEYFKTILPTAKVFQPNLFYNVNDKRCETDGLIIYDQVLFIIEAKGHRITPRARKGFADRTEKHLEEIIQESYEQGLRTLKYIEQSDSAKFKTKYGEQVLINRKDFNEIIIVSLALEPVGNLTMSIKATNDIGYFQDEHFPWIISLYDLVVLADLFENPILLIHYIKRRKKFLSHKILSTYEELDLISYFLSNGLNIEHILRDAKEQNASWIEFMPDTDEINDYYMYKFGYKTKFTEKPKSFISKEFNNLLLQFDSSRMPHRVRMSLLMLEVNKESIKQLMSYIKKIKKLFAEDKRFHDCSIYTHALGGIGITFMTGTNKMELDFKLHQYCSYKLDQLNANTWIGLGDISLDKNAYNLQSMFFSMREKTE
ncbi:MAG: Uncharacterized protein H6Q17_1714 [Bacteroidetes bacterium]|nr:Uncharacterized protein [Bacteroidota bacterium]